MPATISLIGLWNYDPTILDGLAVPTGLDAETVKTNILLDCAELEILYPDPVFLKQAITIWSQERGPIWQKLQDTNLLEYNPIYNVEENRTETRTRSTAGERTRTSTAREESGTEEKGGSTTTSSSAALDSADGTFSDRERAKAEASQNSTSNGSRNENGNEKETGSENEIYTVKRAGNIGVTTSQHMLQEEREVRKFDVIRYIIEDFKQRFCLLIY